MNDRVLGHTGLRVSRLCFGTMSFGGIADEAIAGEMYRRCREAGINFFDCADVYSAGRAEEILGRLVSGERDRVVLTTKVGFKTGEEVNDRGLSARHIVRSVEASLRRLDTEWIDLLFVHTFDPDTSIEETLRGLARVVRSGKVLYVGASNWAAWQLATALGISDRSGLPRFSCVQPMYNLAKRQAEVEILPLARAECLGVITYSPLGGGLLTGKYGVTQRPTAGRLVESALYKARYDDGSYYELAERFAGLAREQGVAPATLAVAWVMAHPAVTAPIIGARSPDQLEQSLAAASFEMSEELYRTISAFAPAPPPATDRSEERQGVTYRGSRETYR